MGHYLNVVGAGGKYVACSIPQPAINTGLPLQVEYEDEFEVRRTATDWPLASTSAIDPTDLIFLKSGSDVEIRSTGNSNWTVATGVDLTQFHVFKYRTTYNGTTITRQLYVDGILKGTTTALSNSRMGAMTAFFGLAGGASRSGDFKYFKRTDFVNSANSRHYNSDASGGTGNIVPELLYGLNGTQQGAWPANDDEWTFYNTGAPANQDVAVLNSQQSAIAPQVALTATQNQTIAAAYQAVTSSQSIITADQLLTVQAAQQSALASSLSISAAQLVAIANNEQANTAAILTVDQSPAATQLIDVLSASQQSIAPSIAVAAEQAITLQHAEQSSVADQLTVTAEQGITMQNAQVQSVADIPAVTALQLVTVGGSAQQASAASVAINQIPSGPITRTIDFKTITARLVTPRFTAKRTTPTFTAKLAS